MQLNVQPIPAVSSRINEVRALTAQIVNKEILPNENLLWAQHTNIRLTPGDIEQARGMREHVKGVVKQAGLWAPHLPVEYGGAGLDFLELTYMNEVLAYAVGGASLFGVPIRPAPTRVHSRPRRGGTATSGSSTATSGSRRTACGLISSSSCAVPRTPRAAARAAA